MSVSPDQPRLGPRSQLGHQPAKELRRLQTRYHHCSLRYQNYLHVASISGMCLDVARSYREGNYVRFFRQVANLPTLFLLAVYKYCKLLLSLAVSVNRLAYKSPNIKFPCDHLAKLLWVSRSGNLQAYLRCRGFKVDNGFVWFGVCGDATEDDADKLATDCFYEHVSNQVPQDSLGKLLLSFNC